MKNWNVLKDREIISLIIGDIAITDNMLYMNLIMPYMRGVDICDFANSLGLNINYIVEKLSRKEYMEKVLDYIIERNLINEFFRKLFELKRFRSLCSRSRNNQSEIYWQTISEFMLKVNQILYYSNCHIEYNLDSYIFSLVDDENEIILSAEVLEKVDNHYIKKIQEQALGVIKTGDYDSAITKSRTMLEEVFIHGIEEKGLEVEAKGNIIKLYNQFKALYNFTSNSDLDLRVNDLLSGFNKIVDSISRMRDLNSDSHGAGVRRISIDYNVAVLYVNSSFTLSNFFLSLVEKNKK